MLRQIWLKHGLLSEMEYFFFFKVCFSLRCCEFHQAHRKPECYAVACISKNAQCLNVLVSGRSFSLGLDRL